MRHVVYTKDAKHPRAVITVECDIDLLVACIKDKEISPDEILPLVRTAMEKINAAVLKGQAKAKAEAEEE